MAAQDARVSAAQPKAHQPIKTYVHTTSQPGLAAAKVGTAVHKICPTLSLPAVQSCPAVRFRNHTHTHVQGSLSRMAELHAPRAQGDTVNTHLCKRVSMCRHEAPPGTAVSSRPLLYQQHHRQHMSLLRTKTCDCPALYHVRSSSPSCSSSASSSTTTPCSLHASVSLYRCDRAVQAPHRADSTPRHRAYRQFEGIRIPGQHHLDLPARHLLWSQSLHQPPTRPAMATAPAHIHPLACQVPAWRAT